MARGMVCRHRLPASPAPWRARLQVTSAGVTISEPFALDMKWDHKHFADPTKWALGSW
jgi:20S proteasome subunit beta 7